MPAKGVRRILQPALYILVALSVHALLFVLPFGNGVRRGEDAVRGVRIRAVGTAAQGSATRTSPVQPPPSFPERVERNRTVTGSAGPSRLYGSVAGPASASSQGTPGDGSSGAPGGPGDGNPAGGANPPPGEFGAYLARLRTEGVQGWARDSAGRMRQGWKGSGKGGGRGFGGGTGADGSGDGNGAGGAGGAGTGGVFLDPRVRMVVTSYPPTSIEQRYTQVRYPDLKIRKSEYTTGWWNVYLQIRTDGSGRVTSLKVLRPETEGPMEKIFIAQVRREVERWSFDRTPAEINVDVRFYVE